MNTTVDANTAPAPRRWGITLLAILACNAVGIAGALFTSTNTAWYGNLVKPAFQPPGWLFGGVLLLPYLAWVSFATLLNGTIVALN